MKQPTKYAHLILITVDWQNTEIVLVMHTHTLYFEGCHKRNRMGKLI